jgi:hypothetical protein
MNVMPRLSRILQQQSWARSTVQVASVLRRQRSSGCPVTPSLIAVLNRSQPDTYQNPSSGIARCATSSSALHATAAHGGHSASDVLRSELELKLPSICCGCGVRLQRVDPDAPGCAYPCHDVPPPASPNVWSQQILQGAATVDRCSHGEGGNAFRPQLSGITVACMHACSKPGVLLRPQHPPLRAFRPRRRRLLPRRRLQWWT